jgi:hypothetical protein
MRVAPPQKFLTSEAVSFKDFQANGATLQTIPTLSEP